MSKKTIPESQQKRLDIFSLVAREYRFSMGLTQDEFSQNSGLHRNTIQRAENGKNITLLTVCELADALDLSLKELFQDIE